MSDRLDDLLELAGKVHKSTDVLLLGYKNGATVRKYAFEISDQEADALFRSPCHYCGYQPPHRFNGIDRVVNNLGYVPGNVVACCSWCNRAKGRFPAERFLAWLQWVKSGATAIAQQESTEPDSPIEWSAPPVPLVERNVYIPYSTAETHAHLGGLTPKEYVRRKVWQDSPIPEPVAIVPPPIVSPPIKPIAAVKVARKPKPAKPVRILRGHDFKGERLERWGRRRRA
jgi:hypothetical protein